MSGSSAIDRLVRRHPARRDVRRCRPIGPQSLFPDDPTEMLAQYYAAVSAQDAWIGELLDRTR